MASSTVVEDAEKIGLKRRWRLVTIEWTVECDASRCGRRACSVSRSDSKSFGREASSSAEHQVERVVVEMKVKLTLATSCWATGGAVGRRLDAD